MIFRDDDISVTTDLAVLKPIHDKFKSAIVMHTVAIIAKDISNNIELISYLKRENFDIQLHCWEHYNFTEIPLNQLKGDIGKALIMFETCGFDRPAVIYPPWNKTSNAVNIMLWDEFKLKVSNIKCSLYYYVANQGNVPFDTINFHYWDEECNDLEEALCIYNAKR